MRSETDMEEWQRNITVQTRQILNVDAQQSL